MTTETYQVLQARMTKAFDLAADEKDWRGPIHRFVSAEKMQRAGVSVADIREAVIHFTATVPTITQLGFGIEVRADGYRAGPAGC